MSDAATLHPFLTMALGMAVVLVGIVVFRLNAFLALIGAALLVSLLAPGDTALKVARVAEAFGRTTGSIGIVIALAAVLGTAMMESGAAARIVGALLGWLGEKRAPAALATGSFVIGVPVFFDTLFYLLVPLARSLYVNTRRSYVSYVLAICAGGVAAHALIPPTPGPLLIANTLGIDLGIMILMGIAIGIPSGIAGLAFAFWVNRRMPVTELMEETAATAQQTDTSAPGPSLVSALMPIVLPVLLISCNTVVASLASSAGASMGGAADPGGISDPNRWAALLPYTALIGNANMALLVGAAYALWLYARQRRPTHAQMATLVETSLMSAGIIILITAAGGAFGAMLQEAQIGPEIQALFGTGTAGLMFLFLAFGVSSLMKIAQGSSTVAMITTSAMLVAMIGDGALLPYHPVYVGMAIGGGSLVCSWMNDSGFWIVSRMSGFSEIETLKSWTPLLVVVGSTAMLMTVILAIVMPLR